MLEGVASRAQILRSCPPCKFGGTERSNALEEENQRLREELAGILFAASSSVLFQPFDLRPTMYRVDARH